MSSPLTPLSVAALALLREREMHPYEMYKVLLERRQDAIVKVKPGSLYHTVDRLAGSGLIDPVATDRDGARPERTTYRITPAGLSALQDAVAEHLCQPLTDYTWFPVAIAEAHNLPAGKVLDLLGTRLTGLREQIRELEGHGADMDLRGVERRYGLTVSYLLAIKKAEAQWLGQIRAGIQDGTIPWESEPPPAG